MRISATARCIAIVTAVWLVSVILWIHPGVVRPDGAGQLVYLPSAWLDHDLLFYNEWQGFGLIQNRHILHKEITATDHLANHWTVGTALVWFPLFAAADTIPRFADFSRNGISLPYNVAVIVASALAGLVTLLAGLRIGRSIVSTHAATTAAIGAWLGTPLLWYATMHATMAHAASAMACALVFLGAMALRERSDRWVAFLTGAAAGLAFSIRPQNAPFAAVPFFLQPRTSPVAYAAGLAAGALPQLIVSWFLYGGPLTFLGGGSTRPFAAFQRVRAWEPLLSWYHGLVPWTPFAALGLIGIVLLRKRDTRLMSACLFAFGSQWLINATLDRTFWGGVAFGQRRFDNCTIVFLIGTAVLVERLGRKAGTALVAATSVWTLTLFFAARRGLDLEAYVEPADVMIDQLRALRDVATQLVPLGGVPEPMRPAVLVMLAAFLLLTAAAAFLLRDMSRRTAAVLAGTYLIAASLFLVWCGSHDRAHLPEYAVLIADNKAYGAMPAAFDFRITLLQQEADWLRKSGRVAEARETEREIAARLAR
ncbi:MAG: hypothetical protein QOH21_3665 [Acidobacteriota bacterium]|nr:hypothetical protein [Acidobacteriota bacterium]